MASEWFHHWEHQYWFCDRSTDSMIDAAFHPVHEVFRGVGELLPRALTVRFGTTRGRVGGSGHDDHPVF